MRLERVEGVKYFELEDFLPLVGCTFRLSHPDAEREFEGKLINAKPIKSDTGIDREPFCVDFRFDPADKLPQASYKVDSANFDEPFDLFLIPYAGDESGWYMTAQFN